MVQDGARRYMCYIFQSLFCKLSLYYISTVTIIFVSMSVYHIYLDRQIGRQIDRQIVRQIDRQIDRQYIKVARGVLIPLIVDSSLYVAYSPFFKFCPPSAFLITSNPQPPRPFLVSYFFDRMGVMRLWIYTCQDLVLQYEQDLDVCFMQQCQVY